MIVLMVLNDSGSYLIREIYENYKARLLVIARSYLGDRAEDAVHDAFVKLIEKYEGNFQELWEMPSSYFVAVVKNRSIDILRRERREIPIDDGTESLFTAEGPETAALQSDELERLTSLLKNLKPQYRQVLERKYIVDQTYDEIGADLSISAQGVYRLVKKAKDELKDLMEGVSPDDR